MTIETNNINLDRIAIIGMAGRFPGANNINEFWNNLINGVNSITTLTDKELIENGVDKNLLQNPNYVKVAPILSDIEKFDAEFFGYSAHEAALIDPQQRLFLEAAWNACEDASYDLERTCDRIGVFGGTTFYGYFFSNLYAHRNNIQGLGAQLMALQGNSPDYLCPRVSYKLNLNGPSVGIQTACSTSLVAVHMACQSLLNYRSDMALAGGVSIRVPQKIGYLYEEGGILSRTGKCRVFDASAEGTVFGSGVGVVLLKRLSDALEDKDHIYAVIKGSAVNNDAALRAGFTAPSVDGQAEVIAEALAAAQVNPETINYVEAHGTGTKLGDPIEIMALTKIFREYTNKKSFCTIGSVKSNVGHLNAASGITGLIKTVLILHNKKIPPLLNFLEPNPEIDFINGPFIINEKVKNLKDNSTLLQASVSSFGMGGTNAHVVLEEMPIKKPKVNDKLPCELFIFSARSAEGLSNNIKNVCEDIVKTSKPLDAAAYTLKIGRKNFNYRAAIIYNNNRQIKEFLQTKKSSTFVSGKKLNNLNVVMMFPGQGTQYVGMAQELYQCSKFCRNKIDLCNQLLKKYINLDIRDFLYPKIHNQTLNVNTQHDINQTLIAQTTLFSTEYSLASLMIELGVKPEIMIGHSVGEYVAACIAGVFTLKDALLLISHRAQLMQSLPTGKMIAIFASNQKIKGLLKGLSLAAINATDLCTVSGREENIKQLQEILTKQKIAFRKLHTSHAFHSDMVEPILKDFRNIFSKVKLTIPTIPFISNLTGNIIKHEEAIDPDYWVQHMRKTVLYSYGLNTAINNNNCILLEVGPGNSLGTFARKHATLNNSIKIIQTLSKNSKDSDFPYLIHALGQLWTLGINIDWQKFYQNRSLSRIPLPTYPFEYKSYWHGDFNENKTDENNLCLIRTKPKSHTRPNITTKYLKPSNPVEKIISEILEELLGLDQVGVYDDFFELGGHSLMATQLISRLNEIFPIEIVFKDIQNSSTIIQISEIVEKKLKEKLDNLTEDEAKKLLKNFEN